MYDRVFIGASDIDSPGVLKWNSDSTLVADGFTNWESGHPKMEDSENCITFHTSTLQWQTSSCTFATQEYLCETI